IEATATTTESDSDKVAKRGGVKQQRQQRATAATVAERGDVERQQLRREATIARATHK
ncbi:hypothetical protein BHE74_00036418, partial [Ensete ventricosum]